LAQAVEVFHSQEIDVEEAVDTIGKARLLVPLKLPISHSRCDTLFPTDIGQAMGHYAQHKVLAKPNPYAQFGAGGCTHT
jgi:hypothetical protein